MRLWKSRHFISKPELFIRVAKSIHRSGEVSSYRFDAEMSIADFRLLRQDG
jgi:hypothetical protein